MTRAHLNALQYLLNAVQHAQGASERTQLMVRRAIARFRMLVAIERAR